MINQSAPLPRLEKAGVRGSVGSEELASHSSPEDTIEEFDNQVLLLPAQIDGVMYSVKRCFVANEQVKLFSILFCGMALFSVICNYRKLKAVVQILALTVCY